MYLIVSIEWFRYCANMWNYPLFLTHNRASAMGTVSIAAEFKTVAANTEAITSPSAVISLPLHFVNSLCGLFNWVKLGYGRITTKPWLNLAILDCCFMKAGTQSLKCLSIPRWMVWRTSDTIIDIRVMHFTFYKKPSEVPPAQASS